MTEPDYRKCLFKLSHLGVFGRFWAASKPFLQNKPPPGGILSSLQAAGCATTYYKIGTPNWQNFERDVQAYLGALVRLEPYLFEMEHVMRQCA